MADETKVRVYKLEVEGTDSINALREALGKLNERLKELNETSAEYEETLKKITELQDKLTAAVNGVSDSYKANTDATKAATDSLKEFKDTVNETTGDAGLGGMKEKVGEVVSKNIELDESLTKEAANMKELKNQIKLLKDRLVQLNEGTSEWEETVDVLCQKQLKLNTVMSASKKETTHLQNSYAALSAEMSALKKRWRETNDEAERSRLGEDIKRINDELKRLDSSIGNYSRSVGSYKEALRDVFGNPRKEIRALREELANLEIGSERYNEVLAQMAELTTRQRKFTEQLRYSSSDLGDILGNLSGVAAGVAGGFSALNALMGLMGNQDSDLQKAMLRTQQLMALVQGLSRLENLKDRIAGLASGIKGFASRFGAANKSVKDFTTDTKAAAGAAQETTGTLDAQAGVTERLAAVIDSLNEKEKETIEISKEQIAQKNAELAVLKQELEVQKSNLMFAVDAEGNVRTAVEVETELSKAKKEKIATLEQEIAKQEEAIEKIIEEGRQRKMLSGELTQEEYNRMKMVDTEEKEVAQITESIVAMEKKIAEYEKEISFYERRIAKGDELKEKERQIYEQDKQLVAMAKEKVATATNEVKTKQEQLAQDRQELTLIQERSAKMKQLVAERTKLRNWQALSILQNRLERGELNQLAKAEKYAAEQKKGHAAMNLFVASTSRVAAMAVKTVKTALISSGIGALLVIFSSLITECYQGIKNVVTGTNKLNEELGVMNARTKELEAQLKEIQSIADGFGFTSFKKASMEIEKMVEIMKSKQEEYNYAIEKGKKDVDELRDAWYESQDAVNDALMDAEIQIEKLILDVEKADRQKGMTQLEKDLEDTNKKFQDAIDLVKTFGEQGVWSADRVAAKINSLNKALEKQTKLLTDAAQSGSTSGKTSGHTGESEYEKQRKEAKKLLEELEENAKSEEKKLRDKYEKQKKLLEKFHLDTTKLTEKYYKDLDKLRVAANKASYDKWKEHLDSELTLMQKRFKYYEITIGKTTTDGFAKMVDEGMKDEIPVMEKAVENLRKDFEYIFGKSADNPLEDFFNIQQLDEYGSRAISITDDIKESMKEMGLDPENIEDIDKMIDKWKLDKKAIEDANNELVKYKSNIKVAAAENADSRIQTNLEAMTANVENEFAIMETETRKFLGLFDGWYDGLSPAKQQEQFEMRYQVIEQGLQQEYDLWKKLADDETLTIEDRNTAITRLNEVIAKQNQTMVQKTIDKNNLLIKSFQNVSSSIESMATNMASIFGTVSDMIMESAQAQLDAGKISEKAYEEQFEKAKAFQIAQATINTIAGAVAAFMNITSTTGGWGVALAAVQAAAVLAAGFAQIQQIRNTKPETSGSGGGGGGSSVAFNLPQVLATEPQRVQNVTNQSDIDALANALGGRLNDQRVYLVESDVENALNKSNKRKVQVSF